MGLIIKNNVVYNGAESEPIIYSEEEREVGVWTDGKPLYQKTYHDSYTNPGSGSHSTNHDLPGIITQVIPGYIRYEYQGGVYYLIGSQIDSYLQITIPETPSPTYFVATQTVGGVTQADIYYTIQYIKEADTPGSGTWTPSGVKAVHYSENEQVVGTWIDGSTLYEKSYTIPQTNSGYTVFNFTGLNINEAINVYAHEGTAFAPSTSEAPYGSAPLSGYAQASAGELGFVGYITHDASTGVYQLHYRVGSYLSGGTARVTVRYNKITS